MATSNEGMDSVERRGHTTMASCAASVAIREASAAGVPDEEHRVIGMRAGWGVLVQLGYEIPSELQVQMGMASAENA